jgi:sodium/hydrogen antiporter
VHGAPEQLASWLTGMTLAVVTTSVIVHGISVTPFMRHYERISD